MRPARRILQSLSLFQSPPPGVDEVVALTEVMKIVKVNRYIYICICIYVYVCIYSDISSSSLSLSFIDRGYEDCQGKYICIYVYIYIYMD